MDGEAPNWPRVTVEQFEAVLATFDYRREAFSNVINYIDKNSGQVFGCEVGMKKTHYRLHPILAYVERS